MSSTSGSDDIVMSVPANAVFAAQIPVQAVGMARLKGSNPLRPQRKIAKPCLAIFLWQEGQFWNQTFKEVGDGDVQEIRQLLDEDKPTQDKSKGSAC